MTGIAVTVIAVTGIAVNGIAVTGIAVYLIPIRNLLSKCSMQNQDGHITIGIIPEHMMSWLIVHIAIQILFMNQT